MKKTKYDENYDMLVKFRYQLDKDRIKLSILNDKFIFVFSCLILFFNLILNYQNLSFIFIFISICSQFIVFYLSEKAFEEQIKLTDEQIKNLPKEIKKDNFFKDIVNIFNFLSLITLMLSFSFIGQ
jgi:amino acid permease